MPFETSTVGRCDRCGKESRYVHPEDREHRHREDWEDWESDWALIWPMTATHYPGQPSRASTQLVCATCLTEAESEQVAEARLRAGADLPMPF